MAANTFADKSESGSVGSGPSLPGRDHEARQRALAAICNPTVNSYKRINAPRTSSEATWAPNTVTWTGNNRIYGPFRDRGGSNFACGRRSEPYLMQAVILAAGIDRVRTKADPGRRYDIDMYQMGHTVKNAPKHR